MKVIFWYRDNKFLTKKYQMKQFNNSEYPLVSIIIPAYNEEKYLRKTLNSLLAIQTRIPYEVIGVDNASTDSTRDVFKSFGIRIIEEPKKGLSKARVAGIRAAQGDIIIQVDADSSVPKTLIDKHLHYYKDSRVVGVSAKSHIVGVHPIVYMWCFGSKYFRKIFGESRDVLYGVGPNISYRKSAVLQIIDQYESHIFRGEDKQMIALLKLKGIVVETFGTDIDTCISGRKYETLQQAIWFVGTSICRKIIWRYEKWFPEEVVLQDVR